MEGVQLLQGYSHFDEAVYFSSFSSQKFLVLTLLSSERWKSELTLEPPSDFEHGTPGLGIQRLNHYKFDFPPRTIYFSSKWSSHKRECFLCFVGFQSLRLTSRIHGLLSSQFFKENETLWYVLFRSWHSQRSRRPEVFCKKGVLKNFTKFTGKHLRQRLFFNKVAGLWWQLL